MKGYKLAISISLFLTYTSVAIAQVGVGINTVNPQALFHIDGASSAATTNPTSGVPNDIQIVDDVTINNKGNLGVGVIDAKAKLEIQSDLPGAIRIEDGTQAEGKVLLSDKDGNVSWGNIAGAWYALLRDANLPHQAAATVRPYTNYSSGYQSNPVLGKVDVANGTITMPYNGAYKILVFGDMASFRSATSIIYSGDFWLYKNGVKLASASILGYSYYQSSFSGQFYIAMNKGDVISLYVDETETSRMKKSSKSNNVTLQVIYMGSQ